MESIVFHFDIHNKQFGKVSLPLNLPDEVAINYILFDSNQNFWIGLNDGLIKVSKSGKIERYKHSDTNVNSLSNNIIQCVYEDLIKNI